MRHIQVHSIVAMPIPRLRAWAIYGIELFFQSCEKERSHTTIHASSRDDVELASVVRQVPIGTRSLAVIGEVGHKKTRSRAMG